jgi:hypothetical protein
MAKKSNQDPSGTSFFNDTIQASVTDLIKMFGEPDDDNNSGDDKVNFEWTCETEAGDVFTVYDWKNYRSISRTEIVSWHIGGPNSMVTDQAVNEIASLFDEIDAN